MWKRAGVRYICEIEEKREGGVCDTCGLVLKHKTYAAKDVWAFENCGEGAGIEFGVAFLQHHRRQSWEVISAYDLNQRWLRTEIFH